MLDASVVRGVSIALAVLGFVGFAWLGRRFPARGARSPRPRASRATGLLLHQVWLAVAFVPLVSLVVGSIAPSWTYATPLNASFPGDVLVQGAAVPLWLAGGALVASSGRALGRFMVPDIVVFEDHELVTSGPYARIRHPIYAALIFMAFGAALLYLHAVLFANALIVLALARARARLEEDLLASAEGLGERYRKYMDTTGRFLPRLR